MIKACNWIKENHEAISALSSILVLIITVAIARYAHKVNKRIAWYTGAMESHSAIMLRIEAEKNGKQVIWWDPDFRDVPSTEKHEDDAKVDIVRMYLRPELRLKNRIKRK